MSRYRQLRGVVRHVLPRVRAGRATGRDPMGGVGFWHRSRVFGVCRWCGFTVEPPALGTKIASFSIPRCGESRSRRRA